MSSVAGKAASVWDFVKRHRGKLVLGGIVAGTVYIGQKYLRNSHLLESPFSVNSLSAESRKRYVFDTNQQTCDSSVLQLIPSLKSKLEKQFDIDVLLETLKTDPNADKIFVWNSIKVLSFSRLFSSVYSYTLLIVSLKVQISIIATNIYAVSHENSPNTNIVGKLFGGEIGGSNGKRHETVAIDAATQQIFLQALHYFITQGSTSLAEKIAAAVSSVVNEISLKTEYDFDAFCQLFNEIRSKIDSMPEWSKYSNFVAPLSASFQRDAAASKNSTQFSQLDELLIRLKSTLDNVQCQQLVTFCLDEFQNVVFEFLRKNWALPNSRPKNPLAKLIPVVTDCFHVVSQTEFESTIQNLLISPTVHDFATRVFNQEIIL